MATYGILYGAEGRPDYIIDGGYATPKEARAAYDPDKRVRYRDGVLGGAAIVELDEAGCPFETIETLAEDAEPCAYCGAAVDPDEGVPAVDDDAAWAALAGVHAPDCEWVETRAHRREGGDDAA